MRQEGVESAALFEGVPTSAAVAVAVNRVRKAMVELADPMHVARLPSKADVSPEISVGRINW